MEQTILICDVCGRQKGETNHWALVVTSKTPSVLGIAFGRLQDENNLADPDELTIEHVCGRECATKRLAQFLGTL